MHSLLTILKNLNLFSRILFGLALFTAVTLVVFYAGLGQVPLFAFLSLFGYALDSVFSLASLLVPPYFVAMALIIEAPWTGWPHVWLLQGVWGPVLTLSLLFRIGGANRTALDALLVSTFSRGGALFLVGFFVVLELLILLGLAYLWRERLLPAQSMRTTEANAPSQSLPNDDGHDEASAAGDDAEHFPEDDIRHDPFFDDEVEVGSAPPQESNPPQVTRSQRAESAESGRAETAEIDEEPEVTVLNWDKLRSRPRAPEARSGDSDLGVGEDPAARAFVEIFHAERKPARPAPSPRTLPNASSPRPSAAFTTYRLNPEGLLKRHAHASSPVRDETIEHNSRILEETLREFNIEAQVVGIKKGPVVTLYEIVPAPGVKLSRIVALADNIALVLACGSVRIVAPIPGKNAVGVEVPNPRRQIVGFDELVTSPAFQEASEELPIALGKDIAGELQIVDLARTPHLLVAGATGSGKSVMVNSLICSLLFKRSPNEVRLLLVDPKIVELKFFNDIPHLLTPVITEPKKALMAAQWCLAEMERRYSLLDSLGVRDIRGYNRKVERRNIATEKLPYIVFIIDEFADLMATTGKELEGIIARLAAMSRAVGIHLVLATQRPSIDVITGLIKANFPSRIAFMVASKTDSRIILDQVGAENLLGKGDMLFSSAWEPFPKRIQAAFLSEEEVENIVAAVKELGAPEYISDEIFIEEEDEVDAGESALDDPLWKKAVEIVTSSKKASASYLQRRMSIGYNRAARLIEEMERQGIVGPQNGSKPRQIIASLVSLTGGGV